ncbi:amidase [Thermorudis peleae]|uniref:amidase n=1 Tax=Thermorudis peleae TaxID=1382356 RepID=UPI000A887217|nr:amidase [Thermorudis peleae]
MSEQLLPYSRMTRRTLIKGAFASTIATQLALWRGFGVGANAKPREVTLANLEEATVADLRAALDQGKVSAYGLTQVYLARIAELNPLLNAVIEVNPDAEAIAAALDKELREKGPRSPLHGIPVLLKDNLDTADKLSTTAGSLALVGAKPPADSTVAARLRAAGAVILGKANMSEWANFRSIRSSSGWSARGGQGRNPYALDRNPCGSSSGSAQAVSANLAAISIGTETDGSIVCPSSICGVVGLKPTVGLVSRNGVIPIAHSQDTVGPICRTVADAAAVLSIIAGPDPQDPATAASAGHAPQDYTRYLDPQGLKGARIGVARQTFFGYSPAADAVIEEAIQVMRDLGAEIIDPADIPTAQQIATSDAELTVLLYEFKHDIAAYLARLGPDFPMKTLEDLIRFNEEHADQELKWFGQELFLMAQEKGPLTDPAYQQALAEERRLGGRDGIDAVMDKYRLDALVAPTGSPAWTIDLINGDHFLGASSSPAAIAGYPLITVPAGYAFGLPVGLTFMGRAFSEPTLIRLAYAFEQATRVRKPPQLLPTIPMD